MRVRRRDTTMKKIDINGLEHTRYLSAEQREYAARVTENSEYVLLNDVQLECSVFLLISGLSPSRFWCHNLRTSVIRSVRHQILALRPSEFASGASDGAFRSKSLHP